MKISGTNFNFKSKPVNISVGYVNDFHGQISNMERLHTAFRNHNFDFKFAAGDNGIGSKNENNIAVDKFMDREKFDASCIGNHELDANRENLTENLRNTQMKYLAANFRPVNGANELSRYIDSSFVLEKKGEKFGVIGLAPCDAFTRIKYPDEYKDFEVDNFEKTIETTQKEINKLQQQGVDKIFLLSHIGHELSKRLAQLTSGIDVIIGGHTHELLKDVKEGENLVTSKSGEPVVITQAGRDGKYYGELNLSFDENGRITRVQNNVNELGKFEQDYVSEFLFNQDLGKPDYIGEIESAPPMPNNFLSEENPHANFIADAMRYELGTDIGILNNANIRNVFRKGRLTSREIKEITPFSNRMTIVPLSEKNIVDALKYVSKSVLSLGNKPGLLAVSGLNYCVNRSTGELVSACYADDNGNKTPIDINNPNPNKILRVAMDDFCASGRDGMTALNNIENAERICDFDKDKLACDYIKKLSQPVEITHSGRLTFV